MTRSAARVDWASRAVVGVGLLITLGLVGLHLENHRHAGPLWRDEVNSVNVATLPSFAEVFANSHLDSFPAAWVTLLHAWTTAGLGETDEALRRLGLLIGLATLAVLWWAGRRLSLGAPLATLVLFAMSPTTIIYGDEVRGYGLGVLAVFWCIGEIWAFVEQPTWKVFVGAQMAAVLAVQAYFGNCFLLLAICAGAGAVCVRRRAWRTLAATIALGAVAGVSVLINLHSILYAARLSPIEQGNYSLTWLVGVFVHALAPEVPLLAALWAAAPVLAAIGCWLAWRLPPSPSTQADKDQAVFVAVTAPAALVTYACYLKYIGVRTQFWYYLPLMGLTALCCDVGTGLLARRLRRGEWVRAAAAAVGALLVASGVAATIPVRMTNLDLMASTLEAEARPDDLIVVLPWYCGITFQRYYRGPAPWISFLTSPSTSSTSTCWWRRR